MRRWLPFSSSPAAALAALVVGLSLAPSGALAQDPSAICGQCHEAQTAIADTKHGVKGDARTPYGSGLGCAACHGSNPNHPGDPAKNPMPNKFGKAHSSEEQNAVCSSCHQGGQQIHWTGSAHDRNGVACSTCHNVHAPKDQVLVTATQAGVCFDCHKDVRAQIFRFSSHPLRTGWMSCSACHAPHGSPTEFQLVRNSVNETCYTCHANKRGPFLWEHPPVRENCADCHTPHGSNNAGLLKARGPYLCQQCHSAGSHPTRLYSGTDLPNGPGANRMIGQNCQNCHVNVHGSNHPSGARFMR